MERIVTFFDCGRVKKRNASEGGCWL
jgi:hypothetical protein